MLATVNNVPDHRDGEESDKDDWGVVNGGNSGGNA